MKDKKNNKYILYVVIVGIVVLGAGAVLLNKGPSTRKGADVKENANVPGMGENANAQGNQKRGFDPSNIDYASLATKLNLSEDVVKAALTVESGQRLDLEKAATTLGVSVADLRTAMGIPEMKDAPKPDGAEPDGSGEPETE